MAPLPPTRERPQSFTSISTTLPDMSGGEDGVAAPRRKRSTGKIIFFGFAIAFAIVLGAFAATALVAKHEIDQLLTPKTAEIRAAQKQLAPALPGKPANILILGSDHRANFDVTDKRSDTILLVRLDPEHKTVSMLSFPRDLWVEIPGHGMDKINDAYTLGGAELTVQTVKKITGMDINFIVNVDFAGFRGIIDKLGGVYIDVDRRYFNDNSSGEQYATIDLQPGYQLLKGRSALAYARYRHTDDDFHRIARQQIVLESLKRQMTTTKLARNADGLFNVMFHNTDMATGGSGKISTRTAIDYIRLALALDSKDIYHFRLDGGIDVSPAGASIVTAGQDAINAQVNAFMHPSSDARNTTASQLLGEKAPAVAQPDTPVVSKSIRIEIRNGNNVDGSAGQAAVRLRSAGWKNVFLPEGIASAADRTDYTTTQVEYAIDSDKGAADEVASTFPGSVVSKMTGVIATKARVLVVVGQDQSVQPPPGSTTGNGGDTTQTAENNKVPAPQRARVLIDPNYGLNDFQALRGHTRVPLLYPTVRETSSQWVDEIRVYRVADKQEVYDAYRLVARTVANDYWGFQATTWPDPPILDHPTREKTIKGITYQLFFDGTKLHRIAWHRGAGTYWVDNSLMNKLSNETMIAIAEGVRPLPRP